MARLGGPSLRWPLPLREPVVPRGRLFRSNRAKCFRGRLMRRILALATFAALSACGVDSRPSEVGQLRLQQSTLVVATATAASDPFQEAISACFDRAYAERSILAPFRGPAEGQYEVTCGKGNVVNREEKANIFEFVLPINYTLEEATFVPTSRTSGGHFTAPTPSRGGAAVRVILSCRGHKDPTGPREWSKGYIDGTMRYHPTEAEQRSILDKCINDTLGDSP